MCPLCRHVCKSIENKSLRGDTMLSPIVNGSEEKDRYFYFFKPKEDG